MKKLAVFLAIAVFALVLVKLRDRAVRSVDFTKRGSALELSKGNGLLDQQRQLEQAAYQKPLAPGAAEEVLDRSPFHFVAVTAAGRYVPITGPLTFRARDRIRLALEIHPKLVAEDMPDGTSPSGAPNRPDVRAAHTSFEVLLDGEGGPKPVAYRAVCAAAPEPSDLSVSLELGGNHDALDAASQRIQRLQLAGSVGSADARAQLAALTAAYASNSPGTYFVRAVYRQGRLATATITVIVTE